MTDARSRGSDDLQVIRDILRRSGHEIRNALSGAAVNSEVVRSRSGRGGAGADIASFAERASAQIAEASSLTDGLLALVGAVLTGGVAPGEKTKALPADGSRIELTIYGDGAASIVSDIERLTSRIGVGVESSGQRVILTILPEGKSHSKD
ncbi:MAG TPA: hypothetical protein VLJ83_00305 [Gemmatimonadaceae bacterium]|nr:hypothetical protein [Gemmatimonadaceae bacterium]